MMSIREKKGSEVPDYCKECEWIKDNSCFFLDISQPNINCEIDEKTGLGKCNTQLKPKSFHLYENVEIIKLSSVNRSQPEFLVSKDRVKIPIEQFKSITEEEFETKRIKAIPLRGGDLWCEHCTTDFTEDIINAKVDTSDLLNAVKKLICPNCNRYSMNLHYLYENMQRSKDPNYIRFSQYHYTNPLAEKERNLRDDRNVSKRFKKQWIDYFGVVFKEKDQIYTNIELKYLNTQNQLDEIAERFFDGTLEEKLFDTYNKYSNVPDKYEDVGKGITNRDFQIPKSYFLKKKKITYIIIGVLLEPTSDLILGRIALFIENVIRKEGMKRDNLDRTQKMIIRDHMKGFTKPIEQFLFHDEDWRLLKLIDQRIVEITRK